MNKERLIFWNGRRLQQVFGLAKNKLHPRFERFLSSAAPPTITNKEYFPYGKANFYSIRKSNQFFIDKSKFIEPLFKSAEHVSIFRPPRFGKSTFLQMMHHFFDKKYENNVGEWNELFNGMDVLKSEQFVKEHARKHHVLFLSLSGIDTTQTASVGQRITEKLNNDMKYFRRDYDINFDIHLDNSVSTLTNLHLSLPPQANFLILIDEYDRFANHLMVENVKKYKEVVQRRNTETGEGAGVLRAFLEKTKEINGLRQVITGVSPIAMADISGYNIANSLSLDSQFGDLFGLKGADVDAGLNAIQSYLGGPNKWPDTEKEKAKTALVAYLDGYRFFGSTEDLFNTQLVIAFLMRLLVDYNGLRSVTLKNNCITIRHMTDTNITVGRSSLDLMQHAAYMIPTALALSNDEVVQTIIRPAFKLQELLSPKFAKTVQVYGVDTTVVDDSVGSEYSFPISYLYYNGAVTLHEPSNSPEDVDNQFKIPNAVIKAEFVMKLNERFGVKHPSVHGFLGVMNANKLKSLLSTICSTEYTTTVFRNNLATEDLLRDVVANGLAHHLSLRKEMWVTPKGTPSGQGLRTDITFFLPSKNTVVVIEFKRIRHNALDLPECLGHVKYTLDEYSEVEALLNANTDEDLLKFAFRPSYAPCDDNKQSLSIVSELCAVASRKTARYVTALLQRNDLPHKLSRENVLAFTAIQLGTNRFLVEEVNPSK